MNRAAGESRLGAFARVGRHRREPVMRIAIVHSAVGSESSIDDQDVLVQAAAVAEALDRLGHHPWTVPATLDLAALRARLEADRPDLIFNLVEGFEGWDSLSHLAPALFDAMGIAYTGNSTEATFLTANKVLAKERLRAAGLPTPDWIGPIAPAKSVVRCAEDHGLGAGARGGAGMPGGADSAPDCACPQALAGRADCCGSMPGAAPEEPGRWILKGAWEQASRCLDDDAVVFGRRKEVLAQLAARAARYGRPWFAERFIAGREFNVALLADGVSVRVLPPAEIDFSAFPPEKPRIVGYRAKWLADSFEYHHTPRRFDFDAADGPLLAELARLAADCWAAFDLSGYVRVDFRVDGQGRPWILEINTNPCLSPDAGFAAALERAGLSFDAAIAAVLTAAMLQR